MRRRDFLQSVGLGIGAAALPRATVAGEGCLQGLQSALDDAPWLLGFRSLEGDGRHAELTTSGRWPGALEGTLYRNGPARFEVGNHRYGHWFDGDGMIQAWEIGGGRVRHRARLIETHKLQAERRAGRALYPGFGSAPPDPVGVTGPDDINTGNISVLAHNDALLALWEAGSPWEIDPETLATRGAHAFSEATAGAPFSAHPRVEPDGTLWNFGYASGAGVIVLYHIDADGRVVKTGTVEVAPMTMPHDFLVTARHIVILLPPLHFRPQGAATFLDAHRWSPEDPTRVLVVDKDDFTRRQWLELPAQWVFHFGNAWEDADGVIRFDGACADGPGAMFDTFRDVMCGQTPRVYPTRHVTYRVDTRRGQASQSLLLDEHLSTEFPVIDPRVSCRRNDRLVLLARWEGDRAPHPMHTSVAVHDARTDDLAIHRYPDHVIPEEHLFVPGPGSGPEGSGWVLGTALDVSAGRTQLNVFDVDAVADGPLATVTLPYALPLGLHGQFVA